MKLVFIIGNAAVGKMTVGQELTKITDLRLFHNHMTIEPILDIFGYFNGKAITRMREIIFEEFAESNNYGLIFTYMWAFDQQSDWDYVEHVGDIFRKHNADIYYVELVASKEIRLQRNATENRLKNKASKRDIEISNQRIMNDDDKYRCVSNEGEIPFENYIKIDNSNLSAEAVAQMIKERFGL
ncbi:AAA family ATPase [Clostridium sp. YIM B02515]|uniref:AAA family ATPase n=1 Tax=Clostridium rhizosphaerae TaxID=2803861 RepID=A0ABS1T9B3_9CLOT|nr:AAA family ATPase [Clostridium rhizosphaerae]MBL4935934.1 AAA family ATPase [Clostridium rhizosphaerae]